MDGFFSLFQAAASRSKWNNTRLGPRFVRCPSGHLFIGQLLFSLYSNDITTDIDSEIRLFADDCVCHRKIKGTEDTVKLQEDIDRLNVFILRG